MNMQGDIAARYTYDAWGDIVSVTDAAGNAITDQDHVANQNPIRYRGYYYDTESGLYYLNSRYYDPVTGRFVNADGYVSTGQNVTDFNMFAYCKNNPANMSDPSGMCPYNGTVADFYRSEQGMPSLDCTCGYTLPIQVIRTDSGRYVHIYAPETDVDNIYPYAENSATIVIDKRHNTTNPDIQVRNSYRVKKDVEKMEIIDVLIEYDKNNPSEVEWGRTKDSLAIEWDAHNHTYNLYPNERSRHVDFDRNDEGTSYLGFWKRAIGAVIG